MMRKLTLLLVVLSLSMPLWAQIGATISITGGSNPTCQGRNVTFSASPSNAGSLPNYTWFVNGLAVSGGIGGSLTINTLNNGDNVFVRIYRSAPPYDSANSNVIMMTVVGNDTPTVSKAITLGSNPGCVNSLIQFTAASTHSGLAPLYTWYLNGIPVGTGITYNNNTAVTGDRVWVRLQPGGSALACYTRDTLYSDTTTLIRLPAPGLPVISFIGHLLVSDSANVQWYGPAGLIPGAVGQTFRPTQPGNYYAVIPNPLCGTGKSNVLIVSPLEVGGVALPEVKVYPNPSTGLVNLDWAGNDTRMIQVYTPAGMKVWETRTSNTNKLQLDMTSWTSGIYFLSMQDANGAKFTTRITLVR
jgi:hypothetical protein